LWPPERRHDRKVTRLERLHGNGGGKDVTPQLAVTFHSPARRHLCRIAVQPSPRPMSIKNVSSSEHLYIRTGNSMRLLTTKEAIESCKSRWKIA